MEMVLRQTDMAHVSLNGIALKQAFTRLSWLPVGMVIFHILWSVCIWIVKAVNI